MHLGETCSVLYATDPLIMKNDQFFIRYMTESADAMVVEDADHTLEPRSDGNAHLHRFLSCADGLIQPRGRKMIFSTNLPSRLNIDEALLRPGRCFACVESRKLTQSEASVLIDDIFSETAIEASAAKFLHSQEFDGKSSLAEVYSTVRRAKAAANSSVVKAEVSV